MKSWRKKDKHFLELYMSQVNWQGASLPALLYLQLPLFEDGLKMASAF